MSDNMETVCKLLSNLEHNMNNQFKYLNDHQQKLETDMKQFFSDVRELGNLKIKCESLEREVADQKNTNHIHTGVIMQLQNKLIDQQQILSERDNTIATFKKDMQNHRNPIWR